MKQIDNDVISLLVDKLRMSVNKAGFSKVVLGLSGGIDSALACKLAVLALGNENVFPYSMPYRTSSQASRDDSALIAEHLDVKLETVDITAMAEGYPAFPTIDSHRKGNILARLRMITLFDKSAEQNALVLGTGNRTEIMLGYMTWFGDSACSVNPLGDMYKTQVYQAAELLCLPQKIINKAPSADLHEGQTDEGDFGYSYAEIDRFLTALLDEGRSEEELAEIYSSELVESITGRMYRNAYKRELPLILSINN